MALLLETMILFWDLKLWNNILTFQDNDYMTFNPVIVRGEHHTSKTLLEPFPRYILVLLVDDFIGHQYKKKKQCKATDLAA